MSKIYRIISKELEGHPSLVLASLKESESPKAIKKWLSESPSWKLQKSVKDSDWNCSLQSIECI